VLLDQVLNLKHRHTHFYKFFNFRTAGYHTAVVVAQYCNWLANQVRPENALTTYIEVVAINQGEEWLHYSG
jgi:hypothetical protein